MRKLKLNSKKAATYTVSGVAFLGAVTGLLVNMTRLGDSLSSEDVGKIQIIPTFIEEAPDKFDLMDMGDPHSVKYGVSKSPDLIDISYKSSVFDSTAKKVGVLGGGPFVGLPKVGIDLKLVNNSDKTIFITDAVINVSQSKTNEEPIFVLNHSVEDAGEIMWFNDGWGEPESVSLVAKIKDTDNELVELPLKRSKFTMYESDPYGFGIWPLISDLAGSETDYRNIIGRNGGDWVDNPSQWADLHLACMRKYGDLDAFALEKSTRDKVQVSANEITDEMLKEHPYRCAINVVGTLTYNWSQNDENKSRSVDFEVLVNVTPSEGFGAGGFEPTGLYDAELQTDASNYSVSVPVSQPISAGGFDRFVIWLGAEKSSKHNLTVTLQYNAEHEISTQTIDLDYFRPRSTMTSSYSE